MRQLRTTCANNQSSPVSRTVVESAGHILFNDNTLIPLNSIMRVSKGPSTAMAGARDLKGRGISPPPALHQAGMVWLYVCQPVLSEAPGTIS